MQPLDTSVFDDPAFFEINTDMLIEEWAAQPRRMRQAGLLLAEARRRASRYSRMLKLKGAKLRLAITADPKAHGVSKPTKDTVDAAILCDKDYQEIQVKLENAQYLADQLENAVTSLVDKRKGLENAVVLHGQNYYADCREPDQKVDMAKLYDAVCETGKGIDKKGGKHGMAAAG